MKIHVLWIFLCSCIYFQASLAVLACSYMVGLGSQKVYCPSFCVYVSQVVQSFDAFQPKCCMDLSSIHRHMCTSLFSVQWNNVLFICLSLFLHVHFVSLCSSFTAEFLFCFSVLRLTLCSGVLLEKLLSSQSITVSAYYGS